jgi:hypothetical protein
VRRAPGGCDTAGPGGDRSAHGQERPRCDHRADDGPAWPTNDNPNDGDLDGHFEYFVGSSSAAAVSGYADITVAVGYVAGLPMGITFIGGRWDEPELIGLAYDYEQATRVRVPLQFIPTIGDALFPGVPNPAQQLRAARQQATDVPRVGDRRALSQLRRAPGRLLVLLHRDRPRPPAWHPSERRSARADGRKPPDRAEAGPTMNTAAPATCRP